MQTVILDPGHGGVLDGVMQTPGGKYSPVGVEGPYTHAGRFIEGLFNRALASKVATGLAALGYRIEWTIGTPDNQHDVPLQQRTNIANKLYAGAPKASMLLVSIHANAGPDGDAWQAATGWEILVQLGLPPDSQSVLAARKLLNAYSAESKSYFLATGKEALRLRPHSQLQPYKQQNLHMCRESNMPAILTENGFMTNRNDLAKLQSDAFMNTLVQTHVKGIDAYFKAL